MGPWNTGCSIQDMEYRIQPTGSMWDRGMLLGKFVNSSPEMKCPPGVKCYLFKTYCCNLYCAPFWYDSTKTALKNIKIT